ncbi:MAG TPA: EamA family transporter RarD, partial [Synergistetes bacterium]|nr:EamA family transporter RarD [Synergistota bacterium]
MATKKIGTTASRETRSGLQAALAAYVAWGLLPLYWKLLAEVPALEILAHRVVWSMLFVSVILVFQGNISKILSICRSPQTALLLLLSSLLIGTNWLVYIWAVNTGKILETSLGYYITPLMNVFLGFVFFRERMEKIQWVAILVAASGVIFQIARYGRFPWVALTLATSFGLYGLIRKQIRVDAIPGLLAETSFLAIPALLYLVHAGVASEGLFLAGEPARDLLLLGTGIVTSLPLLWFAFGARRLRLSTLGFLQYVAPTLA